MSDPISEWWRGAVFYQVYPRSFQDSNGDGVGDLPGITKRLSYIADLGVSGVWISPFFKSPMKDFGYDISDYCAVDPLFGTMDDFDALLEKAHSLGLKIIIDMVLSHTSDQHPWFVESRTSKDNEKSDWYVWADAKKDGALPNNWQSLFGGPAWTFDTKRKQYYMHNFLQEQPDLNYHNADVRDSIIKQCRYWLDKGVDGFRLDVINFLFHDKELRDNPAKDPLKEGFSHQYTGLDPYNMQRHIYDKSQPENIEFIERIRALTDEYPDFFTLGEVGDDDFIKCAADYTKGSKRLNTAYNFALIAGEEVSVEHIRKAIERFEQESEDSWPSWTFCNHDNIRVVSRWGAHLSSEQKTEFSKVLMALLCSLRGSIFLYQGEELGLTEAEIPYEKIQDPWGKHTWPDWQGRDGCRTPMPWCAEQVNAGFSNSNETWLPIPNEHLPLSVENQAIAPDSTLMFSREFLAWRKTQATLIQGNISFLDMKDDKLMCFIRAHGDEKLLCLFNLSEKPKTARISETIIRDNFAVNTGQQEESNVNLLSFGLYYALVS